jgi:predicted dehydrogenase
MAGPDVKLVAMCDVFKDKVDSARAYLKGKYPEQVQVDDARCFVGLDGYRRVIDSVDCVLIACASKFHPMYSEAAIRAGKHVFVEKPHGIDPAGVKRMKAVCELAREKGLSIQSGLQSRWHAGWKETISRVHDGAIGDVVAIQAMYLRAPYQVIPRDRNWSEMEYHFRNWYHFCWLSGDDVPQSLVHNMDRASWVLKEEMPVWAFGLAGRSASFGGQYGDMFDHHTVVYEYKSGVRVYAMATTQENRYHRFGEVILGSKGSCDLVDCRIDGPVKWKYDKPVKDPCEVEQAALMDAIRSGKPINSGYHMYNSTMVTVLGQIACYSGKYTTLKGCWDSDFSFGPLPDAVTWEMETPTKPGPDGDYPLPRPGVTTIL